MVIQHVQFDNLEIGQSTQTAKVEFERRAMPEMRSRTRKEELNVQSTPNDGRISKQTDDVVEQIMGIMMPKCY